MHKFVYEVTFRIVNSTILLIFIFNVSFSNVMLSSVHSVVMCVYIGDIYF